MGRLFKTRNILRFVDEPILRETVECILTRVEHANRFAKAIVIGQPVRQGKKPLDFYRRHRRVHCGSAKKPGSLHQAEIVSDGAEIDFPARNGRHFFQRQWAQHPGDTLAGVAVLKAGMMLDQEFGFDAFSIVQGTFYNRQMQLNRFDIALTDVVKRLTSREPEDFTTITRPYFDKSPYRVRSFSNWLLALKKFMIMPFTPVPNRQELDALNQ